MSIRYTLRHNIPADKIAAEDVNDSSTWDLNLLRKHELAETDQHDIVYRQHDGAIVNWTQAATQHATELIDQMDDIESSINERAAEVEQELDDAEAKATRLTEEAEAANAAAEIAVTDATNAKLAAQDSATLAQDWAVKTDGLVNSEDYSSKYYAGQSSGYATNSSDSADLSKDWATKTNGMVQEDGTNVDYSAKYYAGQSSDSASLSRDWANKTNGVVDEGEYSAKYYANASSTKADLSEDWATKTGSTVDGSEYSSKHYSGVAKDWANKTDGVVADSEYSAKYYAGQASDKANLAEEWATKTSGSVDGNEYSSKYYAGQSSNYADLSSDWANKISGVVADNEYSSKHYALEAKDWSNKTGSTVDGNEYSAKHYAEAAENTWQSIQDYQDYYGMPIGHEYFTFNPNIPQGSLPLFGGEYDRATYPDLWAWVQDQSGYLKTEAQWQALSTSNNGNVPYYSDGDGSTTFRVPSLKCWVRGANGTVTEVGSYLEAGLPNITGRFVVRGNASNAVAGNVSTGGDAINVTESTSLTNSAAGSGSGTTNSRLVSFDASNDNAIYGNSTTVQPESIVGMWLVKAYGTIEDTGTIDEQQYIDDRIATRLPLTGGTMIGDITLADGGNPLSTAGGTMTGTITYEKASNNSDNFNPLMLKVTNITSGTDPSSNRYEYIFRIRDSVDNSLGFLYRRHWANGTQNYALGLNWGTGNNENVLTYTFALNSFNVYTDNVASLGSSSYRWSTVYAATGSINTSDERLKDNIKPIPDDVLDVWGEVGFTQFQFKDSIAKKGESARIHCGLIAQRIKSVFEAHNLDAFRYGLLCYDEWDAEEEERDEDGNVIAEAKPAGNRYSLRYEEALCMEAAYQRRRADRLEERIARLEALIRTE